MSETAVLQNTKVLFPPRRDRDPLFLGVFLSSFAALLLELSLTRLFSVVLYYHFAFLAVSVALLGMGVGGVFAHLQRSRLLVWDLRSLGVRLSFFCAIAIFFALEVALHTSVSVQLSLGSFRRMALLYVAATIPFALTGMLFSIVFARHTQNISRLYGADLAGGALACLLTVPLLDRIGAPNSILFAASVMALAGGVWAGQRPWRFASLILAAAFQVLIVINSIHPAFIDVVYAKGAYRDPARFEFSRWNSISRVEVDTTQDGTKRIAIDSDASTRLMNVDPNHLTPEMQNKLMHSATGMVNALRPQGEFAVIGPGGGRDLVRALASGSPKVTGIEINPIIVNDIMRGRYADYSHHLYDLPGVDVHVRDGRSFIRGSSDKFDVVQMTLVDTWASSAAGAFALTENNLYTVQAFEEYFQHLRPDGMIAVTRWEFKEPREALRVVSVAIEALHRLGVANPSQNLMVVSDGPLEKGVSTLVLAKRSAFTSDEKVIAKNYLQTNAKVVAQYFPDNPPDNPFTRLISSNDPVAFARQYKFNVSPVTDDAPFFFFTLKLGQILHRSVDRGIDWEANLGIAVLGIVLALSVLAVLAFLIIPLAVNPGSRRQGLLPLGYFVAIGLGYILVEITFIQRFVLFLGHPTYALTVVVFLLMLSSGAGSLLSRWWLPRFSLVRWPLIAIAAILFVYVFLLPALLPPLVGQVFIVKLAISAALLVPLGFAMGMPFPTGLRATHAAGESTESSSVEWAWAMNASASVLGSALAMLIALRFGLNVTLACGGAAYCIATILTGTVRRQRLPGTVHAAAPVAA